MEQRSSDWFAARCGKVTASKVHDIIAKTKSGYSASRKNYEAMLIAERLTGEVAESFSNAAMEWGNATEDQAAAAYDFTFGQTTQKVAFVVHPNISDSGASPDRLVGDDGLIEIKCPNTSTHISSLLGAKIKINYRTQMQWQMACTGRLWCDFVSFDPRMPLGLQLHRERVERDEECIQELEREVASFLSEISEKVERLRSLNELEDVA